MENKRTLVISTVAILVVILGVTAFLAYTHLAGNAQPIPVTGGSGGVTNKFESAEQIQAQQNLQSVNNQQGQGFNLIAPSDSDPTWDHIQGQPALPINAVTVDLDPSWDHIAGY